MAWRRRARVAIKWGGIPVLVAVATAWYASRGVSRWSHYSARCEMDLVCGCAEVRLFPSERAHISDLILNGPDFWYPLPAFRWTPRWWATQFGHALRIPLWMPGLAVALATGAAWTPDMLARQRRRALICPRCRYDRTGLPPDAVCPECGAAPL